jgi:hypothetical protein
MVISWACARVAAFGAMFVCVGRGSRAYHCPPRAIPLGVPPHTPSRFSCEQDDKHRDALLNKGSMGMHSAPRGLNSGEVEFPTALSTKVCLSDQRRINQRRPQPYDRIDATSRGSWTATCRMRTRTDCAVCTVSVYTTTCVPSAERQGGCQHERNGPPEEKAG